MDIAAALDPRSIHLVAGCCGLLGAAFLFGMRPPRGALRDAFGLFSLATAMLAAAFVGLGLLGAAESIGGRALSGVLAAGATVPVWQATRRLAGRRAPPSLTALCLALLALALLPLSLAPDMQPWLHLAGSVWSLAFLGMALRELRGASRRGDAGATRLAIGVLGASCLLLAVRVAWLLLAIGGELPSGAPASHGLADSGFALIFATAPFVLATTALAISNARLDAELERLAGTDDLTGLVSRRLLYEQAQGMLARQSGGGCLAVLMIDLDDFKRINDSHGHDAGDEVLRHVAQILRDALREDSLIARYAGDKFCAMVPVASEASAFVVGERLRSAMARSPCLLGERPVVVTASVGVTVHRHGASLRDLLAEADRRAYRAKAAGRNQVVGDEAQ